MPMLLARWVEWRSLAGGLVLAAAATLAVALIEAPGRVPVPAGATAAVASGEPAPSRAAPPAASDKAGGSALILYILMQAARGAPLFAR